MISDSIRMGYTEAGHTMSIEDCIRRLNIPQSKIVEIDPNKEFEISTRSLSPSVTGVDDDGNRVDKIN